MSKVIITRPIEFAHPLQIALQEQNIDSFIFPTIDIEAIPVQAALTHIDYFIFISRNAVTYGQHLLSPTSQTLAIGKGTYQALDKMAYTPSILPEKPYSSEQFLSHPELPISTDDHVAIIKGEGGRNLLQQALEKRAASVQTYDVYRRLISQPTADAITAYQDLINSHCDAIFINSIETLDNLLTLTPAGSLDTLLHQQLITGSQRVIKAAQQAGFLQAPLLAESMTNQDMINCFLKHKA